MEGQTMIKFGTKETRELTPQEKADRIRLLRILEAAENAKR